MYVHTYVFFSFCSFHLVFVFFNSISVLFIFNFFKYVAGTSRGERKPSSDRARREEPEGEGTMGRKKEPAKRNHQTRKTKTIEGQNKRTQHLTERKLTKQNPGTNERTNGNQSL